MIEVGAILSAIVHNTDDLVIILVLLVFNAVVGFWHEYQAGKWYRSINLKKSVEFNPAENIQHKFDKPIGGMS